jgi:hypothetical protein
MDPLNHVAIDLTKHPNKRRYQMPWYKLQREYLNIEEIEVEAESEQEAEKMFDNSLYWESAYDVDTYLYTNRRWIKEDK